MGIPVTESNRAAIEAALKTANGSARRHAFTTFDDVLAVTKEAEGKLREVFLPMKSWPGARFTKTSGRKLPKSYTGRPLVTIMEIEYRSRRWEISLLRRCEAWVGGVGHGGGRLILTHDQHIQATTAFRQKHYSQRKYTLNELRLLNTHKTIIEIPGDIGRADVQQWMDEHTPGAAQMLCSQDHPSLSEPGRPTALAVAFDDPDHAFAFKMRWWGEITDAN